MYIAPAWLRPETKLERIARIEKEKSKRQKIKAKNTFAKLKSQRKKKK